jgi:hypothetical protein
MLCGRDFGPRPDGRANLPHRIGAGTAKASTAKADMVRGGFCPYECRKSARQCFSGSSWSQPGPVWPLPPLVGNPPPASQLDRPGWLLHIGQLAPKVQRGASKAEAGHCWRSPRLRGGDRGLVPEAGQTGSGGNAREGWVGVGETDEGAANVLTWVHSGRTRPTNGRG